MHFKTMGLWVKIQKPVAFSNLDYKIKTKHAVIGKTYNNFSFKLILTITSIKQLV